MFKLTTKLTLVNDFTKGSTQTIAGENSRHRPDAVFYCETDIKRQAPIIFEVKICSSISDLDTISRYMLFSETTENTEGIFCLVIPENYNGKVAKNWQKKCLGKIM